MPPLRFFHQLLTQQAEPAVVYYIRGTSTNVGGSETFNIQFIQDGAQTPDRAETITCAVDAQGNWKYEYSGKKIYGSLAQFAYQTATITELDFSAADDLLYVTSISELAADTSVLKKVIFSQTLENVTIQYNNIGAFQNSSALLVAPNATFARLASAFKMFRGNTNIGVLNLPSATFASAMSAKQMFSFSNFAQILMPSATFASATDIAEICINNTNVTLVEFGNQLDLSNVTTASSGNELGMFYNCTNLVEIRGLGLQTFANLVNARDMFRNCSALTTIDLHSATFAKVNASPSMWNGCSALTSLNLQSATFAVGQDLRALFLNCTNLQTINLQSATFAKATRLDLLFDGCAALTSITGGNGILLPNTASATSFDLSAAPLTYQSMLNVANWLYDLTGGTAKAVTFKTSAWNALTAAEQANIDSILTAKNWTRQLA